MSTQKEVTITKAQKIVLTIVAIAVFLIVVGHIQGGDITLG